MKNLTKKNAYYFLKMCWVNMFPFRYFSIEAGISSYLNSKEVNAETVGA